MTKIYGKNSATPDARRGASGLAYGLMIGLVAIVALGATTNIGDNVDGMMTNVADNLSGAAANGPALPTSNAPVNTALPTISGVPETGQSLSANAGTWTGTPAPSYSYQWLRDGVDISGATTSTYLLNGLDLNALISVRVTGSNSAGSSSAISAQTIAITSGTQVDLASATLTQEDDTPIYTFYTIPLNQCSVTSGWYTGITYSDTGAGSWWSSGGELAINETTMNNCVSTQAGWGSDGTGSIQSLVADLNSPRVVRFIMIGGDHVSGWGGSIYTNTSFIDYYDANTSSWVNLVDNSSIPGHLNKWYIFELKNPIVTSQIRYGNNGGWASTNNLRIGQ